MASNPRAEKELVWRIFLISSAVMLVFAAAGKFTTVFRPSILLQMQDPIFAFAKQRDVYLFAGFLEVALAVGLLATVLNASLGRGMAALGTFVLILLTYRIGAHWLGYRGTCNCLGTPGKWMLADPRHLDFLAIGFLAYWAAGVLAWSARKLYAGYGVRVVVILAGVLVGTPTICSAEYVRVTGHITARSLRPSGDVITNQVWRYEVSMTRSNWVLRSIYDPQSDWYSELFGHGTNIFNALSDPRADEDWPLPGTVVPVPYPSHDSYYITVPWLAFCSFLFFANGNSLALPLPDMQASVRVDAHLSRARVSFLDTSFRLPQAIAFVADNERAKQAADSDYLRTESLSEDEKLSRFQRYVGRIPDGTVIGEYEVEAVTNLHGGMAVPLRFQLTRYGFSPDITNPQAVTTYPSLMFEGHVETLQVVNGNLSQPLLPKAVSVADYRLRSPNDGVDFVQYSITNGQWLTEISDSMRDLLSIKVNEARRLRRIESLKRLGVLSVMTAIVSVPLVWSLLRWVKRRGVTTVTC